MLDKKGQGVELLPVGLGIPVKLRMITSFSESQIK
jgi:hypothetical protein